MNLRTIEKGREAAESIAESKLAYSVEELSKKSTLSEAFLRLEIKKGRLKATHFGRRILVLADDWQTYSKQGSEGNKPKAA
ncbi:MAG TPA: hypothetical protein VF644_03065 [Pyrinomonadaceae bacterium]